MKEVIKFSKVGFTVRDTGVLLEQDSEQKQQHKQTKQKVEYSEDDLRRKKMMLKDTGKQKFQTVGIHISRQNRQPC